MARLPTSVAQLYRMSPGAMLGFIGHALMKNCSAFIMQGDLGRAEGRPKRRAACGAIPPPLIWLLR